MNKTTTKSIHGNMLKINGCGVIISGKAGIGKSDIALHLIDRGHQFISDDYVEIYHDKNTLMAYCPKVSEQFLLLHGIGLINVDKIYPGPRSLSSCELHLIIHLIRPDEGDRVEDPLHPLITEQKILGVCVPEIQLIADKQRNLALLIEILVKNWQLKRTGYDAVNDFNQRQTHINGHKKND